MKNILLVLSIFTAITVSLIKITYIIRGGYFGIGSEMLVPLFYVGGWLHLTNHKVEA